VSTIEEVAICEDFVYALDADGRLLQANSRTLGVTDVSVQDQRVIAVFVFNSEVYIAYRLTTGSLMMLDRVASHLPFTKLRTLETLSLVHSELICIDYPRGLLIMKRGRHNSVVALSTQAEIFSRLLGEYSTCSYNHGCFNICEQLDTARGVKVTSFDLLGKTGWTWRILDVNTDLQYQRVSEGLLCLAQGHVIIVRPDNSLVSVACGRVSSVKFRDDLAEFLIIFTDGSLMYSPNPQLLLQLDLSDNFATFFEGDLLFLLDLSLHKLHVVELQSLTLLKTQSVLGAISSLAYDPYADVTVFGGSHGQLWLRDPC
jgi:hypothetical protein